MKRTFYSYWGWSNRGNWNNGDPHPDAVRLPDGTVVCIRGDDFQVAKHQHLCKHPRSRAKYAPMTGDGSVRLLCEGESDGGFCKARGRAWARTSVIAPHGSTFLYGGRCCHCEDRIPYSDDPCSSPVCTSCREEEAELDRLLEDQRQEMAADARVA